MTLLEVAKATLADGSTVKAEVACQIVRSRENVTKAGKPYLDLEISDGTAVEKFKIWEDSDAYEAFHDFEDGDVSQCFGILEVGVLGQRVELVTQHLRGHGHHHEDNNA